MAAGVHPVSGSPGFAIVDLGTGLSLQQFTFRIRRDGASHLYLGRNGSWIPKAEDLSPHRIDKSTGATRLIVGPPVVNSILEEENIILEIPAAGFQLPLTWPSISHSSDSRTDADPFGPLRREVDTIEEGPTAPGSEQNPEEMPPLAGSGTHAGEVGQTAAATASDHHAFGSSEPLPKPLDEKPPETRKWWILAAALTAAIVGGVIAWQFHSMQQAPPSIPQSPSLPQAQPGPNDELVRLLEEVRALVEAGGDVGKIADGGQRLIASDQPDLQSAGIKVLANAASRGSAVAQLALGKLFDPRYFERRGGATAPDATIAAEYYRDAKNGGLPVAGDELQGMCTHLRETTPPSRHTADVTLPPQCSP